MQNQRNEISTSPARTYFPGLHALRFFAAMLVILGHIPVNQLAVGLPAHGFWPIFTRGADGVNFFFTLSGFLITYLLLEERGSKGQISLSRFYLRRTLRIWPLYFLIVSFGLFFYLFLLPCLGIPHKSDFNLSAVLWMYLLFLPHLVNSLFEVGGILYVCWSIGIEEQFYLLWAPIVKKWYRALLPICLGLALVFLGLHFSCISGIISEGPLLTFLTQLRFHFMAIGGLFAYFLFNKTAQMRKSPLFRGSLFRPILWLCLLTYLFLLPHELYVRIQMFQVLVALLYAWLISDIAINQDKYSFLDNRLFNWLGNISYGLYMFHMLALYATSFLFLRLSGLHANFVFYQCLYYIVAISLTLILAHFSYYYFERRFLALKKW